MKQVYLDTYGCQMNVADTDRMELLLFHSGYARTGEMADADLILINTCSIREKAEQKIYSLVGSLKPLKDANPELILGLTGCLAQQEGERLHQRMPFLDLILGPDGIEHIVQVVDEARDTNRTVIRTHFDSDKNYRIPELSGETPMHPGPSTFVNIIKGCDKFCTFCVVPFTRGREKSREAEEIEREVKLLVSRGAKEIILLGQNVNAYGKHGLRHPVAFHELLYRVASIPGVERLRFTTSHPMDFTRECIDAYRDIDVLVNHLHLPVQSGNNRVLQEMRRSHTVEEYIDLIEELKAKVPDIAVSTDIIVGFPEETDAEFEDTLALMERVGFSSSFMFCYSPRPGTPAQDFPDSVPQSVKSARLQKTIELQDRLTREQGQRFVGREVEVLVEGRAYKYGADFKGRNPQYWRVNFTGDREQILPGDRVTVAVEEVFGHALKGRAVSRMRNGTWMGLKENESAAVR
ncbi:MAG: tRNA (N6-isopentenyl adenosine(37)-C2)-methylthiotransferase MiaB [Nitrospinae bacterium]|nr:tRNA (N6-isopentenyl adenosine(37)-C2)-methylthiotransferase MiaB [Nitrospinota bacterium]